MATGARRVGRHCYGWPMARRRTTGKGAGDWVSVGRDLGGCAVERWPCPLDSCSSGVDRGAAAAANGRRGRGQ
jgi:hypothetical protein